MRYRDLKRIQKKFKFISKALVAGDIVMWDHDPKKYFLVCSNEIDSDFHFVNRTVTQYVAELLSLTDKNITTMFYNNHVSCWILKNPLKDIY